MSAAGRDFAIIPNRNSRELIAVSSEPGRWLPGYWCKGHGVHDADAESLRAGHYVKGQYVPHCVTTHQIRGGGKGLAPNPEPRCNICRSIRQWHDDLGNARRRAHAFRRQHADRWVKNGRRPSIADALEEMDTGGVTADALVQLMLAHLGQPCPGLCAKEVDGKIHIHTIDRIADMHIDVKDPGQPFTLENIGILCSSCNPSKGDQPWATFVFRRRATLQMWQDAIDNVDYRRAEAVPLPFDEIENEQLPFGETA